MFDKTFFFFSLKFKKKRLKKKPKDLRKQRWKKKMTTWTCTNIDVNTFLQENRFVFLTKPNFWWTGLEAGSLQPPILPEAFEFFEKAKTGFFLFGHQILNVRLYFQIRNNHFLELISKRSRRWKNKTLLQNEVYSAYLTLVFYNLITKLKCSHLRCRDKFKKSAVQFLFNVNKLDYQVMFRFWVLDSARYADLLNPEKNRPSAVKFDFVAYAQLNDVPKQFSKRFGSEQEVYYVQKHKLDMFLQRNGIIETGNVRQWPPPNADNIENDDIQEIADLYGSVFGLQIRVFVNNVPDILRTITAVHEENRDNEIHKRSPEFTKIIRNNREDILTYYMDPQFKSKYPVLFAVSQLWRLLHWMYLS